MRYPTYITNGALAVVVVAAFGCRLDMHDQPKYEAMEPSALFEDGRASREPVKGTIARGRLRDDRQDYYTGKDANGDDLRTLPRGLNVDAALLVRGQTRYNVFCSPCHGYNGYANGMVVQRGFQPPPSFHTSRLREAGIGHFYDVISNGYGAMYSYGASVPPDDRWAIAVYIRALQLSQFVSVSDLSEAEKDKVDAGTIENHPADYGAPGHLAYEDEVLKVSGYQWSSDDHHHGASQHGSDHEAAGPGSDHGEAGHGHD
jgi:hypothetical protein